MSWNTWEHIISSVLQVSILRPLLFNIFSCDFFFEDGTNYFTNDADDATPLFSRNITTEVLTSLTEQINKLTL